MPMNREAFDRLGYVFLRIAVVLEAMSMVMFIFFLGVFMHSYPDRASTAAMFGLRAIFYSSLLCGCIFLFCVISGPKRPAACAGLVVALLLGGTSGFLSEGDPNPIKHSQTMGDSCKGASGFECLIERS
jgi:hypothetical protein